MWFVMCVHRGMLCSVGRTFRALFSHVYVRVDALRIHIMYTYIYIYIMALRLCQSISNDVLEEGVAVEGVLFTVIM